MDALASELDRLNAYCASHPGAVDTCRWCGAATDDLWIEEDDLTGEWFAECGTPCR